MFTQSLLNQSARAQHFVVGVRGNDDDATFMNRRQRRDARSRDAIIPCVLRGTAVPFINN
jgi:hypothetical protein